MQDDVRVTVVATGLNRNAARQNVRRENAAGRRNVRVSSRRTGTDDLPVDYAQACRVSDSRNTGGGETVKPKGQATVSQSEYLDIPAFLRRQAD